MPFKKATFPSQEVIPDGKVPGAAGLKAEPGEARCFLSVVMSQVQMGLGGPMGTLKSQTQSPLAGGTTSGTTLAHPSRAELTFGSDT